MLLMQKIEEMTCRYSDSRAVVGKYLMKKKGKIKNLSMQQIADETYTSRSTLVRVAQKLGFSGWNDFVKSFLEECSSMDKYTAYVDPNIPFKEEDSFEEISMQLGNLKMESCLNTAEIMSGEDLRKAVDILKKSSRIVVLSMAPNLYLAHLFRRKMLSIGKSVEISGEGEHALLVESLSHNDCAILISYSGNNKDRFPVSMISFLKRNQVPIIGITSEGNNVLRQESEATLTIVSNERLYSKISTYATEESILMILDILFSCYFSLDYKANLERKIESARQHQLRRYTEQQNMKEEL